MSPQSLLILGVTGGTGKQTLEQALEGGHKVTVHVRNGESHRLPSDLKNKENLTIIESDLASLPAKLEPLLPSLNAIISVLGPNATSSPTYKGTPITTFYKDVLERIRALPAGKRPYVLAMGTQSIVDPSDGFNLMTKVHILIIKNLMRTVRKELIGLGKVFKDELEKSKTQKDSEKLDWTVYRLNLVKDFGWAKTGARAGYVGDEDWKATIDRAQLAAWLIEEAEKKQWVRKLPALWGEDPNEA